MIQVCFWFLWCLAGFVGWNSWLAKACPPGACSGMLVAMQLGDLVLPFFLWLVLGIGISVSLAYARDGRDAEPPLDGAKPHPPEVEIGQPPSPENVNDAAMRELGVSFDGEKYCFREYRYDRLVDALAYAKLVKEDRAT